MFQNKKKVQNPHLVDILWILHQR